MYLILLSAVFAYAVFRSGGTRPQDWNLCLSALGLLGLLFWGRRKRDAAPPLDPRLRLLTPLLPLYIAFQLLPMPAALLRLLSPERAAILASASRALPASGFAPLSVAPAETLAQLMRVCACTIVFLLVRELSWQFRDRPWNIVLPLLAVAAVEAGLGLLQYAGDPDPAAQARGTYVNKNHFAGLLEMTLPLAAIYPPALFRREGAAALSSARAAVKACAAVSVAALILIAILYSFSRMGFVAALSAIFFTSAVAIAPGFSPWKKGLVAAGFALLFVLSFLFLPSDEFIRQYAKLSSLEKVVGEGRFPLWAETLHLIAEYPLFGCGLGGYESAFAKYQASFLAQRVDYAHNDYLQLLAELGILGFLIAGRLAAAVVLPALHAATARSSADRRYLAAGCMGAFAAILIHSLVDFNSYIPANGLLLSWISGLAAGLRFISPDPRRDAAPIPPP